MTIKLADIPTRAPKHLEKDQVKEELKDMADKIGELQNRLYANKKHSLLVVLQGMDGTGKDSTTRALFDKCSPSGVQATAYKKPTEEEFAHDFLWRIHKQVPEKGMVKIFNRSHYEDILIQYVHGWIDDKKRDLRMKSINTFEETLQYDANTVIVKFYMHMSPDEQHKQLMERVEDPEKYWKHNDGDWEERKLWDKYRDAYDYVLNNSSIPWTILPCDQEWYRNYVAAKTVIAALEKLDMGYPPLNSTLFKPKA
jgi:PPK2 family polyphosphate:nucleotide phosphotransferase